MKHGAREFQGYWEETKRQLPKVLLLSVVAALVAWGIAARIRPTHEVHFSYLVSLSQRDIVNEYRFDGFYALQATDLFAATLAKWAATPEVVVAAYQEAGLELPSEDPRSLARAVRAEKSAPQLVTVTVRDQSREVAEALAAGLQEIIEENVATYHAQGVPAVQFRVVGTQPWTGVTKISVPIVVVATFIAALLLAVNAVLLIANMRSESSKASKSR